MASHRSPSCPAWVTPWAPGSQASGLDFLAVAGSPGSAAGRRTEGQSPRRNLASFALGRRWTDGWSCPAGSGSLKKPNHRAAWAAGRAPRSPRAFVAREKPEAGASTPCAPCAPAGGGGEEGPVLPPVPAGALRTQGTGSSCQGTLTRTKDSPAKSLLSSWAHSAVFLRQSPVSGALLKHLASENLANCEAVIEKEVPVTSAQHCSAAGTALTSRHRRTL